MSPPVPRKREKVMSLSCVWLFTTPWTVTCQAPPSWYFPGKNTGMGCHFLLQGNLPDPGIKPGSPALQADFLWLEPPGAPILSPTRYQLNPTKPLQEAKRSLATFRPRPLHKGHCPQWLSQPYKHGWKTLYRRESWGNAAWMGIQNCRNPPHSLLTSSISPPHLPCMAWPRKHIRENKSDKSSLQVLPKYGHLILFPLKSKQLGETAAHMID